MIYSVVYIIKCFLIFSIERYLNFVFQVGHIRFLSQRKWKKRWYHLDIEREKIRKIVKEKEKADKKIQKRREKLKLLWKIFFKKGKCKSRQIRMFMLHSLTDWNKRLSISVKRRDFKCTHSLPLHPFPTPWCF